MPATLRTRATLIQRFISHPLHECRPSESPSRIHYAQRERNLHGQRLIAYAHLPVPWHFRREDEQLPGSANLPSGPMQVWVWMHQNKPSFEAGTVGSGSVRMNCAFQRRAGQRSGCVGVEAIGFRRWSTWQSCDTSRHGFQDGSLDGNFRELNFVGIVTERRCVLQRGIGGSFRDVLGDALPHQHAAPPRASATAPAQHIRSRRARTGPSSRSSSAPTAATASGQSKACFCRIS